jgi:hypothetical protein
MSTETTTATTTETTSTQKRVLIVQSPEQWTGAINEQTHLEIPATMDVAAQETAWFAQGGDSSGKTFAQYLLANGATQLVVEVWNINYQ